MKKEKQYVPPKAEAKGNTKNLVVGAIHKSCSSSSARVKKG
ncbi:MAG: hypothetical protein WC587_00240 [Candidatus Paceibacterota bacterium]